MPRAALTPEWRHDAGALGSVALVTDQAHDGPDRQRSARRLRPVADWLPVAAQLVALLLWAYALTGINLDAMGDTGLVSVLPVTYYLALAAVLAAFVAELTRPTPRGWVLAVSVAVLVAILQATIPILYHEPRYSYVYKHIAVTRYVELHGSVDRTIEIYQNWSGFPGAAAQLSSITGLDPMALANWAQPFFAAANVLAVRFAVRALTTDVRVVALACVTYLLGDWVGQGYFAPQALAFLVSVVTVGVVLRCLPPRRPVAEPGALDGGSGTRRRLRRLLVPMRSGVPVDGPVPLPASVAIVLTLALTAVVVLTHPLSPFLLVVWLAVLVLLGRGRLWWLPVAALAMTVVWTLAAHDWLSTHVDLFADVGAAAENARGTGGPSPGSPGHQLVVLAARVLSLGIWMAAAVGGAVRFFSGRRNLTAPLLAVAPFSLLLAQSYGGEIIYRVFLFSLPWCSFLIASAVLVGPVRHRRSGRGGQLAVEATTRRRLGAWSMLLIAMGLAALTVLFLFAYFGLERVNRMQPDEVAASTWFEEHAAPGSVLTLVAPDFPTEVTARYDQFRTPWGTFGAAVIDQEPNFVGRELTAADVPTVIGYLHQFGSGDVYVALSPSQEAFVDAFGTAPPGAVTRLGELLTAAPGVDVVYRRGDVTILKLPPLNQGTG